MGESGNGVVQQKTALYDRHCRMGAKMVDFAGWQMPLQYTSVLEEHRAVREQVGVFDVSHMAEIVCRGKDAACFLDSLSTNDILSKNSGVVIYACLPNGKGGTVDDVLFFKESDAVVTVVVNASNREKDLLHLQSHATDFAVDIEPLFTGYGILAVQGPDSLALLQEVFVEVKQLKKMRFSPVVWKGYTLVVSRTGYTGADGFEIAGCDEAIVLLWDLFTQQAKPCGLGARDTLRLEAGFALYGQELSDTILASESVSSWTIKKKNRLFLGSDQLDQGFRHQYGVVIEGRGIARKGCAVFFKDREIGVVTSGSFSPSLEKGIAIIMVDEELQKGDSVLIQVRGQKLLATFVQLPFI